MGITGIPKNVTIKECDPCDYCKSNPSLSLTWTAGELTQIDQLIDGTTYRKTLTWTAGELTAVSAWSEV